MDQETRRDKRAPVSLKVRFKSATLDEFIEQYSTDISRGGIFIKSKSPMPVGTLLKFEFQLRDSTSLIQGVGRVVWKRDPDPDKPDLPPGMGIKFIKMDGDSRSVVDRVVAGKDSAGPSFDEIDLPPQSSQRLPAAADDTRANRSPPSGVNPSDLLTQALNSAVVAPTREAERRREASQAGFLPGGIAPRAGGDGHRGGAAGMAAAAEPFARPIVPPMPRHPDPPPPPPVAPPALKIDRPSPGPGGSGTPPRGIDAGVRSGLAAAPIVPIVNPATSAMNRAVAEARPMVPIAPPVISRGRRSATPVIVLVLLLMGGGGGVAVWRLAGSSSAGPGPAASPAAPSAGAEAAPAPRSAAAATPAPAPPAPPIVASATLQIGSQPLGAQVYLGDALQQGATPMEVAAEAGAAMIVRIRFAGYREWTQRVVARAGRTEISATLEALPRFLVIESEPSGASVLLGGRDRGRTPARVRLDAAGPVELRLVKGGYQEYSTTISPDQNWAEEGGMLTQQVRAALTAVPAAEVVAARPAPPPVARLAPAPRPVARPASTEEPVAARPPPEPRPRPVAPPPPPPEPRPRPRPAATEGPAPLPENPY